ncbi:hypothetical protein MKX01_028616 [Papaver californicum]|nr:hypothetical protein MKX01_028616 [Papaver californicum]
MVVYKSALSWCHSISIPVKHKMLNAYLLSLIMKCWQEGDLAMGKCLLKILLSPVSANCIQKIWLEVNGKIRIGFL